MAATIHLNKLEREENLVAAFSFFDKDASGCITVDELQQAWKQFGIKDSNLDKMIKDIDQDSVSDIHCFLVKELSQSLMVFACFIGWKNRLWRICGNDEKRQWWQ